MVCMFRGTNNHICLSILGYFIHTHGRKVILFTKDIIKNEYSFERILIFKHQNFANSCTRGDNPISHLC